MLSGAHICGTDKHHRGRRRKLVSVGGLGGHSRNLQGSNEMGAARYVGRVGGLAVALGVGAAVASGYGVAAADTSGSGSSSSGSSSSNSSSTAGASSGSS